VLLRRELHPIVISTLSVSCYPCQQLTYEVLCRTFLTASNVVESNHKYSAKSVGKKEEELGVSFDNSCATVAQAATVEHESDRP
jgi:hypothetical protein